MDSSGAVPSGVRRPGHRAIGEHRTRRLARRIATCMFREVVRRLVSREVTDTQCGLKLFSRRAALEIFSRTTIDGFAFDAEVVLLTHLLQIPFRRVPVTLVNEYGSTISLRRHALPMLLEVLRHLATGTVGQVFARAAIRRSEFRAPSRGRADWMGRLAPATCRKIALAAWAVFIALAVNACVHPSQHTNYSPCFESGCKAWWNGENMYDHHVVPSDFRYGPLFAVALTPLAMLPTWLGGLLWNWLNLGLFFWAVHALARRVLPCRWTLQREAAFLLLTLAGSARTIWSAQSNPLIFAAVAAAAIAILDRRWWLSAVLLAAPVHIKVWPLAAALLLIACWPRQLGWRFAVALVVLAAVPLLTKPLPVVLARYHDWYTAMSGPMLEIRHQYRDAWTIWELIAKPVDLTAYLVLQLSTAIGTLSLCLWQKERLRSTAKLLCFVLCVWTAWQLVFGPATERNTFGLIAPFTAWAAVVAVAERHGRVWIIAALFLTDVLAIGQVERGLALLWPDVPAAAHPFGVLLFAGWLIHYARGWETGEDQPPHAEGNTLARLACAGPGG